MTASTSMNLDTTLLDEQHLSTPTRPIVASADSPTLLPAPLASLVSFTTAATSLGLRVGGFIGNAAISGARIGTLTSFELGRVVLEGILARAGNDVVSSSLRDHGRAEAEGLLTRALSTLHYSITSTSFLVSAGFQIGSTSLSSGLAISHFFLSGLDAILGDTETSKAVATIVVLVQREFKNPETGINGEKVGLGDLIVGATAFALLQRWGRKKTDQELRQTNATETVWDIVVINDDQEHGNKVHAVSGLSDDQPPQVAAGHARPRSMSFVSATGDRETFEGIGDGASFMSTNSSRAFSNTSGQLPHPAEETFRRQLADHLKPGSSVRLTAESITRDCVTVEVRGDLEAHVEPPAGFKLIAVDRQDHREPSSTFVFQRRARKRRHGSFDVEQQSSQYGGPQLSAFENRMIDHLATVESYESWPRLEQTASEEELAHKAQEQQSVGTVEAADEVEPAGYFEQIHPKERPSIAVTANQKRPRSPLVARSEQHLTPAYLPEHPAAVHVLKSTRPDFQFSKVGQDQSPLRKALSKSKSVKNLVEFWSRERLKHPGGGGGTLRSMASSGSLPTVYATSYPLSSTTATSQPLSHAHIAASEIEDGISPDGSDGPASFLKEPRPTSSMSHRRHRSSMNSTTSIVSENSLILKPLGDEIDDTAAFLHRNGGLTGQFPRNSFATNAARFARFSLASYGSNFLRLTGTLSGEHLTSFNDEHLPEHHSFSTYTNLPASTVLISSYVDPRGGGDFTGDVESAMPLVHYVSLDHASRAVVLTCRGTLGFEDILTDMTCDYTNITWQSKTYQVHKGMYSSAKRLFTLNDGRVLATIRAALEEFDDYGLVLCGHSMGGAVASVLAIILAEKNTTSAGGSSRFVTATNRLSNGEHILPPNRPLHVYAYGPAACVSPDLQYATRGLVTSIVYGNDIVPYLSLGTLRDFQAVALAFKIDSHVAKTEVRRRVWEGLVNAFRSKSGLGASGFCFSQEWLGAAPAEEDEEEDQWAWSALKSLRASLLTDKLVPPGDVYLIESAPVLQRHAFVSPPVKETSSASKRKGEPTSKSEPVRLSEDEDSRRSYKPATRITFRYVRDAETRFGEIRFGAGMFADHFPARYMRALEDLEKAVGS